VFKIGPEIADEMAAGINCAYTQVYAGLEIAQLRAGQTVVVQGAGGLGVYACAVAREMGAGRVVVIDGLDERLELARQFGATDVVDMRRHSTPAERVAAVKKLTDDWGGDVVLELVGHPGVVDEGLRMTAPEGTTSRWATSTSAGRRSSILHGSSSAIVRSSGSPTTRRSTCEEPSISCAAP